MLYHKYDDIINKIINKLSCSPMIVRGLMFFIVFIYQTGRKHIKKREKNTVIPKIALTRKQCGTY